MAFSISFSLMYQPRMDPNDSFSRTMCIRPCSESSRVTWKYNTQYFNKDFDFLFSKQVSLSWGPSIWCLCTCRVRPDWVFSEPAKGTRPYLNGKKTLKSHKTSSDFFAVVVVTASMSCFFCTKYTVSKPWANREQPWAPPQKSWFYFFGSWKNREQTVSKPWARKGQFSTCLLQQNASDNWNSDLNLPPFDEISMPNCA